MEISQKIKCVLPLIWHNYLFQKYNSDQLLMDSLVKEKPTMLIGKISVMLLMKYLE